MKCLLSPFRLLGSAGLSCWRRHQPESTAFVNRDMVGFVALDQILGRFSRSVVDVSLDLCVSSKLLDDDSADPASLGIPPDVVTNLECFRHPENHCGSACPSLVIG